MDVLWKDIVGFDGAYQVSNDGQVRSVARTVIASTGSVYHLKGKLLRPADNGDGYLFVALRCAGKYVQRTVHRLVAEAFIPNPEHKETVNHIDGNKSNNLVANLEWATQAENNTHAIQLGLRSGWTQEARARVSLASKLREGKAVRCVTTGQVFSSMREAEKTLGLGASVVSRSIYEMRETHGYRFELVDPSELYKEPKAKIDGRTKKRPVICMTTGQQFINKSVADRELGLPPGSVHYSIQSNRPIHGLQFDYVEA